MGARCELFDNGISPKFAERFAGAGLVVRQSPPPRSAQELVALRAGQIDGCGRCIDMHTEEEAAGGETAVRLHPVAAWRESTVFTDAERAAPALAGEGTRLADAHQGVSDGTRDQVRKHCDDDRIAALVALVAWSRWSTRSTGSP